MYLERWLPLEVGTCAAAHFEDLKGLLTNYSLTIAALNNPALPAHSKAMPINVLTAATDSIVGRIQSAAATEAEFIVGAEEKPNL